MVAQKFSTQALGLCVATNTNVILWGMPGIGKTTTVQSIAFENNMNLEVVIAAIRDPTDFAGLPGVINEETVIIPPQWARNIVKAFNGDEEGKNRQASLTLLDEISTAEEATQAALLRPVLERVVGDLVIPKSTRFVGAANPPDIATNGWDLKPPMAARFTHLDWQISATEMQIGFTIGWPVIEIPRLPKNIIQQKNIRAAKALIGSFIGSREHLVSPKISNFSGSNTRNKDFSAADNSFPNPRSWESVAVLYAGAQAARFKDGSKIDPYVTKILLEGTVGVGATQEFLTFVNALHLPDPEYLLAHPESFEMPDRGDELWAVLTSVQHALDDKNDVKRWNSFGDILSHVATSRMGDVAFVFAKRWLSSGRPEGALIKTTHREAFSVLFSELDPQSQW